MLNGRPEAVALFFLAALMLGAPSPRSAAAETRAAAVDSLQPQMARIPEKEPDPVVEPAPAGPGPSAVSPTPAAAPVASPPAPPPHDDAAILEQPAIDDIELQMNGDVLRWVNFFTGAGRSSFERWLKRSGRYMELFRNVLMREGLPADLVHLVFVESGFNLQARSYAHAVGPWQFLRGTAQMFGLNVNQWIDERKDPEKATVAAARYLKHLHGIFNDWPLALASYNAGEGAVLRAIKKQGTTNYWDLRLSRQTEEYVPKFMAAVAISRSPERYGFSEVELDDPLAFDELALTGTVDLRQMARLCECTVEELRALNPALLGTTARPVNGVVALRVPEGRSEIVQQRLGAGERLPAVDVKVRHRVRRNETLSGIAGAYGVSARELANVNGIGRKKPLKRGQLLTVPTSLRSPVPEILDPTTDPRASTAFVPSRERRLPAQIAGRSSAEGRSSWYVRRGQTLAAIADSTGTTVEDLMRWNRLTSSRVRPGSRLQIRSGEAALEPQARRDSIQIAALEPPSPARRSSRATAGSRTHVVRRGETLSGIASRHGVSIGSLRKLNGLRSDKVMAGSRLRLPV